MDPPAASTPASTPALESWSVGRLLTWTTDYLKRHGSASPRLDAEVLLAHVRACSRIELYTSFNDEVPESDRAAFRELIRERAKGKPVAYLVGHREFYSLSFTVTPDVLIPRPATENLVDALLDVARGMPPNLEIVDIGTGTGILAVCAARHLPEARITAVDISLPALDVARRNIEQLGLSNRIHLSHGDLFASLPADQRFDLIVSNPPYVSSVEFDQLPADVRDFEPKVALVSGPTGTEVFERLLVQSVDRVQPGGWFICEVSPMIARSVQDLIAANGQWHPPRWIKDIEGHQRVVVTQSRRAATI